MAEGAPPPGDPETQLRRQLRWAYALVAVLAVLLLISLVAGRKKRVAATGPGPAGSYRTAFDTCLEQLSAGEAERALPACEDAVELQPANLSARHNLGYAYRATGRTDEAIETFRTVLESDPLNARSMYELGSAYADAGRVDEARATFEQLLEIQPDHGWARIRLDELAD